MKPIELFNLYRPSTLKDIENITDKLNTPERQALNAALYSLLVHHGAKKPNLTQTKLPI